MASCTTAQWVANAPQVKLTVTQSSSTDTSATLSWTLEYISAYPAAAGSRNYSVTINGSTVKSGSYNIDGVTGTKKVASGTTSITKGTSAKAISFGVSFEFNVTWSGVYGGTKSASGSISVAAKTSYTVSYNANGGSGAPSNQTKWHGTNITLSTTTPTRTGYTFKGWATSSSGSVAYEAGATYSANASATLYAVWQAITYTVSYNANGGSGAPSNQTKTYGVNLTLSSNKPTRTNYNFKGWGTSSSSTTVSYAAGATYTANAAITLYAVWELAYTKPRITNLSALRCDSSGTASEEGTYAKVSFNWATDKAVSSIKIEWKLASSSTWSNATISSSGTSGSVTQVIGSGELSTESTYDIRSTVTDASGSSTSKVTLSGYAYTVDIIDGGNGIAFGMPAESSNLVDFNWIAKFRKGISGYSINPIYSSDYDTVENWRALNNSVHFISGADHVKEQPSTYGLILNLLVGSDGHQLWLTQPNGSIAHRGYNSNGLGGSWIHILDTENYSNYALPKAGGTISGELTTTGLLSPKGILLPNESGLSEPLGRICGTYTDGTTGNLLSLSSGDNVRVGFGSYSTKKGNTNLYTNTSFTLYTAANGTGYINGRQIKFGAPYSSGVCAITCYWNDDKYHDMVYRPTNGTDLYFGVADGLPTSNVFLRGKTVRLYSHSGGAVYLGYSGSTAVTSDRNLKKDIVNLDKKFESFFYKLRPITYKYNVEDMPSHRDHVGFIAQEVEQALLDSNLSTENFAGIVIERDVTINPDADSNLSDEEIKAKDKHYDTLYSLRYEEFIALNTHMIQKLKAKVDEQQSEIDELKRQVAELKALVLKE